MGTKEMFTKTKTGMDVLNMFCLDLYHACTYWTGGTWESGVMRVGIWVGTWVWIWVLARWNLRVQGCRIHSSYSVEVGGYAMVIDDDCDEYLAGCLSTPSAQVAIASNYDTNKYRPSYKTHFCKDIYLLGRSSYVAAQTIRSDRVLDAISVHLVHQLSGLQGMVRYLTWSMDILDLRVLLYSYSCPVKQWTDSKHANISSR
ncbi:hypothetical protein ES702_00510 [subsurface metagenome]